MPPKSAHALCGTLHLYLLSLSGSPKIQMLKIDYLCAINDGGSAGTEQVFRVEEGMQSEVMAFSLVPKLGLPRCQARQKQIHVLY